MVKYPSFDLNMWKPFLACCCCHSVVSNSLRPCPSPSPGACSNSRPLSQWCHWTISSSVVPCSSCLQSFPASGSFLMSRLFTSGGRVSASVLLTTIQDWFPLGLTGLVSLQSRGLSSLLQYHSWSWPIVGGVESCLRVTQWHLQMPLSIRKGRQLWWSFQP